MIFDDRICALGEGPLWHPLRHQLFWFDITGKRLLTRDADGPTEWSFDEMVSAAGWISRDDLLIASETALFRFDLATGTRIDLVALEADDPGTRSNDGRADSQGGFWIGTMSKRGGADPGRGAFYRYYRGELRRLYHGISITNSISFTPDGRTARFSDTLTARVMQVALDGAGWPVGEPELFLDLKAEGLNPDGAVIDGAGLMWMAQWGAGRVAAYAPDGTLVRTVAFDAPHTSCPAFGGADGMTLHCTTALEHMSADALAAYPHSGKTFTAPGIALGQSEHQVLI
jgi:sugar lactone lactonase YvrE